MCLHLAYMHSVNANKIFSSPFIIIFRRRRIYVRDKEVLLYNCTICELIENGFLTDTLKIRFKF